MDTLTHALSGALLARATAPADAPARSIPRRVAAGFFACAAPDLDFVLGFVSPLVYLEQHRGPTHSLLLLPLWALLLSWLLAKILREPRGWTALYGVCALALGAHIVGDLITSFGTIVFAPLSDARYAWGTTFIIDLWFSGIILAGLAASLAWRGSRLPALAASVVLVGYVAFQALQKERALDYAREYAAQQGWSGEVSALPRAVSPFNWTVYVSDAAAHRFAHVNLRRTAPAPAAHDLVGRMDAAFLPLSQARWETRMRYGEDATSQALAREAWESPALGFFRWFAGMPAFDGLGTGSTCAWFVDLRFVNPGRDWVPFQYGACREVPGAPWRAYERAAGAPGAPLR
ncbi:MAG: metal-dependent hydrolase [Betaproteobacteria bacterium]|nr:metal-dependent hydrolase [Betaproteobacteria bacterium]MDH5220744.1 metal-dependent hydrolase [Betaproteobacteria bacterium]MDH5350512.1 metal-dependent hydrolase [Betaproteobacteria bacterium]